MREVIDDVLNTDPVVVLVIWLVFSSVIQCIMAFVIRSLEKDVEAMEFLIEHMIDILNNEK